MPPRYSNDDEAPQLQTQQPIERAALGIGDSPPGELNAGGPRPRPAPASVDAPPSSALSTGQLSNAENLETSERKKSSMKRALTNEEQRIIHDPINGRGPGNEVLAEHGADLVLRESFWRLRPGKWLNSDIINYYGKVCLAKRDEMLCAEQPGRKRSFFFGTYFLTKMFDGGRYDYTNVKRASKQVPGKDLFNLKYIFCPINIDNEHWTSAAIFMEEKRIKYYDSMGKTDQTKLEGLLQYLEDEYREKKGGVLDTSEWKLEKCTPEDTPQQLNSKLCAFGDGAVDL